MTKVEHVSFVPLAGARRPACEVIVKKPQQLPARPNKGIPASDTGEWKRRVARNALKGLPPEQCGWDAMYKIDGVCMCRAHAGGAALSILFAQQEKRPMEEQWQQRRYPGQTSAPAPKLIDGSQYMAQMQKGLEMMDRLRTIAGECGATLGEGAFYDSIDMTGMTPEQLAEYGRRIREEGLGIADFGVLK